MASAAASKSVVAVAPKGVVMVDELQPEHKNCTVLVKILRKWSVYLKHSGNSPATLELVLVDTKGTEIQGHIDKMHIYKHAKHLHEGHVYTISKFQVGLNVGEYRATRHSYRLIINLSTIIRPAARIDSIPDPEIVFTPPTECLAKEFNKDYLGDVAGVFHGYGAEYPFNRGNGTSTRMSIELENRGYRFSITLFGEYVTEVKQLLATEKADNVVLAFRWLKVDDFKERRSLQTTMHTSKMLINPDIPETVMLREALTEPLTSPTLTITQGSNSSAPRDGFVLGNEQHSIAMVRERMELSIFEVLANIEVVVNDDDWWYYACKCHKKAVPDSEMYYCSRCDTHVMEVSRKFLLKLRITDEHDSATVIVFDNHARVLIGRSADDVYDSWQQDEERDYMPAELRGLEGKQALFKIKCETTAGSRFPRQYRVVNLSDDRGLIGRYQEMWGNNVAALDVPPELLLLENTPTTETGSVQPISDIQAQDLIERFDAATPGSITSSKGKEVVDITKDNEDTPPLKRKSPVGSGAPSVPLPLKTIKVEKKE